MAIPTAELARRLQATAEWLACDPRANDSLIYLALPKSASFDTLSFLSNPGAAKHLGQAGAVLVEPHHQHLVSRPLVVKRTGDSDCSRPSMATHSKRKPFN